MTSEPDSAASTPRAGAQPDVRLMCSFGGRILPRPHDNQLRYVGGDTRIVAVPRSITFAPLHAKLSKIAALPDLVIKYQLPNEDLDALISVSTDEDVDNMMDELDRLPVGRTTPRLRLFLFPAGDDEDAGGGSFGSLLSKRDSWFLDALNSGRLERGRSEASSIVSEVPDYLFGLDANDDAAKYKPSPYGSSSSTSAAAPPPPPPPELPPAKTEPQVQVPVQVQPTPVHHGNPVWQYMQEAPPVYYMNGPAAGRGVPVRPVQVPVQYFNPAAPVGYGQPVQGMWGGPAHTGAPVYMGGPPVVRPAMYEYPVGAAEGVYQMAAAPAMGHGGGEPAAGSDTRTGRASQ